MDISNLIASAFEFLAAFLLVFLIIGIIVYIISSIFLNKLNKLIFGKGTALAWIPIANIYLLGKLTVNNIFGWVLIFWMIIQSSYTTTINDVPTTRTILPEVISKPVSILFYITIIILIICAIGKYINLKKKPKVQAVELVDDDTIQDMQLTSPSFFQPISIGKNLHTAEIPVQGDMQTNVNIQPNNIQGANTNIAEQPINQNTPIQPMIQNLQNNIQSNAESIQNNLINQQDISNQNVNSNLVQDIPDHIKNEFIPVPEKLEPIVDTTSNQPNFDEVFGVSMGHLDTDISSNETVAQENTIQSSNENILQLPVMQQPIQQQIVPQQPTIQTAITPNNGQVTQMAISNPQPRQVQQQPQMVQPINQSLQNSVQSNVVQSTVNATPIQNTTLNNQVIANQQQSQMNMIPCQPIVQTPNIQTTAQPNIVQNSIPQQQVINNIPVQPNNTSMNYNQQSNVIQPRQVINQNLNTQIPVQPNISTVKTIPTVKTPNANSQVLGMNTQQQTIQPQQNINNNTFNKGTM